MALAIGAHLPSTAATRPAVTSSLRTSGPVNDDNDPSYADLALRAVPARMSLAMDLLASLTRVTRPGEVKALRVALLEARESLDIFAYVYPNNVYEPAPMADSNTTTAWGRFLKELGKLLKELMDWIHHHSGATPPPPPATPPPGSSGAHPQAGAGARAMAAGLRPSTHGAGCGKGGALGWGRHDLWFQVREDLDAGYEALGDFQDLDHSLVEYNETDVEAKRAVCLDWQATLANNSATYHYLGFVRNGVDPHTLYEHKHASRLFWGYHGTRPSTGLSGRENLKRLLRDSQLQLLLDSYPAVLALGPDDLLEDPGHSTFHNFRKLLRSILSVLSFFPELLPDDPQPAAAAPGAQASSGGGPALSDDGGCHPGAAVRAFASLFKELGQTNNKVFAYQFYRDRGMGPEAEDAHQQVEEGWADDVAWMEKVQVDELARCLAASLAPGRT
ncbi:hypothetical protein HYH03_013017 [Edaphochlamys debaryana]|uniref:Uncharacterized protein n=1 Tax=Edaphochlamys debaryana TaxID=47281 RepID=A0A836BV11_9CHLO|nr:hypothetical protein HYH03_013017 [Edaphochlamys debaryana]|eukprot:KAG2488514.1 hypothetical protein HYH03_013017 [Edaphochlamys debaryana]